MQLDDYKVDGLTTLHYLSGFISPAQESALLKEIRSSKVRYTVISGRRLQVYGGQVHGKHGLIQAPIPRWLADIVHQVSSCTGVFGKPAVKRVIGLTDCMSAVMPGRQESCPQNPAPSALLSAFSG